MSKEFYKTNFSNSKEELEFYRNTYKIKVEELLSCQTKIKALENINNKLKEQIIQGFSNKIGNNDSSKLFYSPIEFKKLWESVIQTELIDSFDFCIKEYKLISNLSQDLMLLVYDETKKIIDIKFLDILKCLNLTKTSKNKKDNLYGKILPFFRENFNDAFEFNEEKINNIKQKLQKIVTQYNFLNEINLIKNSSSKSLNEINIINNNTNENNVENNKIENMKILENKIKGKNFEGIIKSFFTICLYMLLHEPILTLNIEKYTQRKLTYYFYSKKDFINIEGFGNERTPCVVILQPPLLKNKYEFNGLRPAVYIISDLNINKEIINQCQVNEKIKEEENKMKNNENKNDNLINNNNNNDKKIKIKNKIIKNHINQKFKEENIFDLLQKPNKIDNLNEYNKININYSNYIQNNNEKILNKSAKINNENIFYGSIEEINNNFKIKKSKINTNNNQNIKYNNHIIINRKGHKLENINNFKTSKQNLSYGHIQNQNKNLNNQIKFKLNYLNNNNNLENSNYFINSNKDNFQIYNENIFTDRRIRKEKTLPEKLKYENNLEISDKNPFLNYSHKISNDKNSNGLYPKTNIENSIKQNVNNKKKIKNNNILNDNQLKYLNKTNNNSKNKNMNYQNKRGEEKFKRNNTVGIPSSEKINIKYYSSFNNILTDKSNNFARQLTNINDNNNQNNFKTNYITLKKINLNKIKQDYDNNSNSKKNNYYSYDDYYEDNNIDDNIKFTERKIRLNQNNKKFYNNDCKNILYNKKRGVETSIQQNKYNPYNLKDNYLITKSNLYPIFSSINFNEKEEKIKNNTFGGKNQLLSSQNINYINSINNINNFNNINNINNIKQINYYNNIYNNIYNNSNLLSNLNNEYSNQNIEKVNLNKKNNINININRNNTNIKKNDNNKNNENKINNFNRSLKANNNTKINKAESKYNNYIIPNKNEKANKNQVSNERNQVGQSLSPYYFKSQNQLNNQNNPKNKLYKNNYNLKEERRKSKNNNIESKQYKDKNIKKKSKNVLNNNDINNNYNNNTINKKNISKQNYTNNNNLNYQKYNEFDNQQNNSIIRNKNIKKRNKSLNATNLHYNNNISNNNDFDNININQQNCQNFQNIFNDSYNMNNYYLNELEVIQLNDKYKFNDDYSKEYGYT